MKKLICLSSVFFGVSLVLADSQAQSWRDAEWRHPVIYQDLYEENIWDPDFLGDEITLSANNLRVLRGSVQEFRRVRLENPLGIREQHWIGKIKLANGSSVVVDFGTSLLRDILNSSDGMIEMRGRIGRISGRRVLFAQEVKVKRQSVRLR